MNNKQWRIWFFLIVLGGVLVGGEALSGENNQAKWGRSVFLPGKRVGVWFVQETLLTPLRWVANARQAVQRVQDLEIRLSETAAMAAANDGKLAEAIALQNTCSATDSAQVTKPRWLSAAITAYGKPAIAGGSAVGMVSGSAVLSHGTLVGIIGQVEPTWATVVLLNDPALPPIVASTPQGVVGVLRGEQRKFWLSEIPIDQQVELGEWIKTSGQAGISPNLLIGRAKAIELLPGMPTYRVEVEQLVSFDQQRVVEVRQW